MPKKLPRDYQRTLIDQAFDAWRTVRTVLVVSPARSGKTVLFTNVIEEFRQPCIVVAHRTELLAQASATLAENGVVHRVIGSQQLMRDCIQEHLAVTGQNFINQRAPVAIASVDTLRQLKADDPFLQTVRLLIIDEGHHCLRENKWGKCVDLVPHAKILLVTATPDRADGKGLGLQADGYAEVMFVGPTPRELIDRDLICDYKVYAPPNDLDLSTVGLSTGGDFRQDQLAVAVHKSRKLVGNIVEEYLRRCKGMLGMTFCVDIESAKEITAAFRAAGVAAELVTGETPSALRTEIMKRYRRRQVHMLVNVELFGEGVNVPDMEVVILARPTESYGLFIQQSFRPLTKKDGKTHGIIIDHVGNFDRHASRRGLPCGPQPWTLRRRDKRTSSKGPTDVIPTRTCLRLVPPGWMPALGRPERAPEGMERDELLQAGWGACGCVYERIHLVCPDCGDPPEAGPGRRTIEQVDGVLHLVDPAIYADVMKKIADHMRLAPKAMLPGAAGAGLVKSHNERLKSLEKLRTAMEWWSGWKQATEFWEIPQIQAAFFFRFKIDMATAQTGSASEMDELREYIETDLRAANIVDSAGNRVYSLAIN